MHSGLALLSALVVSLCSAGSIFNPTPHAVKFVGQELYVDNEPFYIKGLCYSPVPIGETIEHYPFGDYFTPEYAYLWKRDLPLIKEMGVNTIRIYGWDTTHNITHYEFLDEVHKYGLKVVLTFYVGRRMDKPAVFINTPELMQVPLSNFTREVALYGDHPAILMWSYGNELNGPWNGFLSQIAEVNGCVYKDYGHCWNKETLSDTCLEEVDCLYKGFFGWLNDAAVQAKQFTNRPVTSGLADLDRIVDRNSRQVVAKIQLYGHYAPDLAAWALQLYKGEKFSGFLKDYKSNMVDFKPLVVTEYGVDAYNDPCGWLENRGLNVCRNMVGDEVGGVLPLPNGTFIGCERKDLPCSHPGSDIQLEWDVKLTKELYANRVPAPGTTPAPTPEPVCDGPWDGYDQCQPRMQWMEGNWAKVDGVDSSACSWQRHIYEENSAYCPDPFKSSSGVGVVIGGFLMAWIDERWKGNIPTQAYCQKPCDPYNVSDCVAHTNDYEPRQVAICTFGSFNVRAHWECTHDTYYHGLCGYGFESMPDFYMNEEWFGLSVPTACGHFVPSNTTGNDPDENPQQYGLDEIMPRPVMKALQEWWAPEKYAQGIPFTPSNCATLLPCWQCLQDNLDVPGPAAYLNQCASVCNINPPPPTMPPTLEPTQRPTTQPTDNPIVVPTPASPTNVPPTRLPTAKGADVQFTVQLSEFTGEPKSFVDEFTAEIGMFFVISLDRISGVRLETAANGMMLVDFTLSEPVDTTEKTTDQVLSELEEELGFLELDPSYGCEGADCVIYSGGLTGGKILQDLVPVYGVVINRDLIPDGPGGGGNDGKSRSSTVVVFVVALVVVLMLGSLAYWQREQQRAKKLRAFLVDSSDNTDYLPPAEGGLN